MIKHTLLLAVICMLAFSFGCKSKRQQSEPNVANVQSAEQITEENMDAVLEKMEKEIAADTNSQQ
jgi:hypothetical protein